VYFYLRGDTHSWCFITPNASQHEESDQKNFGRVHITKGVIEDYRTIRPLCGKSVLSDGKVDLAYRRYRIAVPAMKQGNVCIECYRNILSNNKSVIASCQNIMFISGSVEINGQLVRSNEDIQKIIQGEIDKAIEKERQKHHEELEKEKRQHELHIEYITHAVATPPKINE